MAKVSRPIIYVAVLGAVAYAVLMLTEPENAGKKAAKAKGTAVATAPKGFLPEDLNASFPRYTTVVRNAFQPKIVPTKKDTSGTTASAKLTELWKLTGVSKIDSVVNALVESSAGETAFLKVGDQWNGHHVVAIEPTGVSLVSDKGESARLVFASPEEQEKPMSAAAAPLLLPTPAPASGAAPAVDPQQDRNARRAERRAARQGGGE